MNVKPSQEQIAENTKKLVDLVRDFQEESGIFKQKFEKIENQLSSLEENTKLFHSVIENTLKSHIQKTEDRTHDYLNFKQEVLGLIEGINNELREIKDRQTEHSNRYINTTQSIKDEIEKIRPEFKKELDRLDSVNRNLNKLFEDRLDTVSDNLKGIRQSDFTNLNSLLNQRIDTIDNSLKKIPTIKDIQDILQMNIAHYRQKNSWKT